MRKMHISPDMVEHKIPEIGLTVITSEKRVYFETPEFTTVVDSNKERLHHYLSTSTPEWTELQYITTAVPDGSYLVVVEGHGTKYVKVDHYDADDHQWKCEYEDPAVRVTHVMEKPELP